MWLEKLDGTYDWEERMSYFLKAAAQRPEDEAMICEELCEFVMHLVKRDRAVVLELLEDSHENQ